MKARNDALSSSHIMTLRLSPLFLIGLELSFLLVITEVQFIDVQHFFVEQVRGVTALAAVSHYGKSVE